jgi:heme-degrading monooxygenase HmoA
MHIQIINFQLKDLSEDEYINLCEQVAPSFAAVPGLISKVFLADRETGTYGGVYTWQDRAAMEAFAGTDLFAAVANNPNLSGLTSRDFAVLDGPTAVTRGLAAMAA